MPGSVYAPVKTDARAEEREVCPLNVGDTWLPAMEGARFEDILESEHPGLNRYSDPRGIPELIDAIVEKLRACNEIQAERSSVLVSAGATSALAAAVGTLAAPGEEVLILAPFWPLIRGAVQAFRGTPVEVPFYDRVDSPEAAVEAVRERLTPRTVALYVCTPSNPTGRVLPEAQLAALAEFARSENLWLISDEVYEDYVYRGEHISLARFAPERTLTSFSFSKAYGMAGYRVGYLVDLRRGVCSRGARAGWIARAANTAPWPSRRAVRWECRRPKVRRSSFSMPVAFSTSAALRACWRTCSRTALRSRPARLAARPMRIGSASVTPPRHRTRCSARSTA